MYQFNYSTFADEDCRYPVETHWTIEFDRTPEIPGTWNDAPEGGEITITAKHLDSVTLWLGDWGQKVEITDYKTAALELGKRLDEELLIEAAEAWYERFGREVDEERAA